MTCDVYKCKGQPVTCYAGTEGEKKYSSTLSLTSAFNKLWCSVPRHCCFRPWILPRYLLYRRLGGPKSWSERGSNPVRPGRSGALYRLRIERGTCDVLVTTLPVGVETSR